MQDKARMKDLTKNREFNVWEYHVSHGSLLLRSPKRENVDTNIDIVFTGVEYICGPSILGVIDFSSPTETELRVVFDAIANKMERCTLWAWNTKSSRLLIAGLSFEINENKHEITSSPFVLIKKAPYQ